VQAKTTFSLRYEIGERCLVACCNRFAQTISQTGRAHSCASSFPLLSFNRLPLKNSTVSSNEEILPNHHAFSLSHNSYNPSPRRWLSPLKLQRALCPHRTTIGFSFSESPVNPIRWYVELSVLLLFRYHQISGRLHEHYLITNYEFSFIVVSMLGVLGTFPFPV